MKRSRSNGFTLLELLLVIGILTLLLGALIPAVTSLSKSSGRKAGVKLLVGILEQARATAIKDGRSTYVAFAAQPTSGTTSLTDQTLIDRYFYHAFAVFEDDPAGTAKVQITSWKILPVGISLRTEISFDNASNGAWGTTDFVFTPAPSGSQTQQFPFIKFNANGEVVAPPARAGSTSTSAIPLRLFEGYVTDKIEKPTSKANMDETINLARLTGRAEYTP